jgi:hypothetical protein
MTQRNFDQVTYQTRQKAFQQISNAIQVVSNQPTKKTFLGHFFDPNKKFLDLLNKVKSHCPDFTYKVDANIPENAVADHYIVKAIEALATISRSEKDPMVIGIIGEAINAGNSLLNRLAKNNNAEMSK